MAWTLAFTWALEVDISKTSVEKKFQYSFVFGDASDVDTCASNEIRNTNLAWFASNIFTASIRWNLHHVCKAVWLLMSWVLTYVSTSLVSKIILTTSLFPLCMQNVKLFPNHCFVHGHWRVYQSAISHQRISTSTMRSKNQGCVSSTSSSVNTCLIL